MRPDFSLIWGADNAPFTAIEASDYTAGWVFRTGAPPRRVNFDYFQNLSDQRTAWLGEQMLLAVGHEWQDDVTYDAYAITRSPANGQLYRSLVGSNLGNEPSVSGAQWAPGLGNEVPSSLLTSGIAGSFSNLKASATGTNATVTVTADAICLKNTANEQVVVNSVAVAPSLAVSGVGGLDTGTGASSTWYSVWVIWNGSIASGLLSASTTSPILPVGYTHKARVGWVRSDPTANKYPISFTQYGKEVQYKVSTGSNLIALPTVAAGVQGSFATPTWISASLASILPPTAFRVHLTLYLGVALGTMMAAPSDAYGAYNSATNPPPAVLGQVGGGTPNGIVATFQLEGGTNIFVAHQASSNVTRVFGWEDNL